MKNISKTNSYNRGQVIQAAIIALVFACGSLSTRAAAVQIPEEALESDAWRMPAGDLGQPINTEADRINAPLMNVKGEVAGISEPLGKALQQTSTASVSLRRVPLPGPAKASLVRPADEDSDSELARPLAMSLQRDTHRFSFGQSENCRRFELVCSFIGIP